MTGGAAKGFLIAAPQSGAGKTTVSLALLRALRNAGKKVVSAKSGPDYIDPKFHEAASGRSCINLDAWAMSLDHIHGLAGTHAKADEYLVVEGAMGLFDGAANGKGSGADLAACLGLPVILVVDCAKQAQSVAALVSGFASFRFDVRIAGVILNRVGSDRHERMLRAALEPLCLPVLGALPRLGELLLPERHLGLVQAEEHRGLEAFLEAAAKIFAEKIDLELLSSLAMPLVASPSPCPSVLPPLGQRMAIARDVAFAFAYPHLLDGWQASGAELSFFSPIADESPAFDADAIYLPGGYPELHAGKLANASGFKTGMNTAASNDTLIYGECGGYMTLGEVLRDGDGTSHEMLGLLPLETSFATRKRHLGYRVLEPHGRLPWSVPLSAHEFHYASICSEGPGEALFAAKDAEGNILPDMGLRNGTVLGSFAHVIDSA
ncbi:cobyrinate a,c-diamide synthase [Roseibium algae]|uniref:Hydrogenobyrinate a,c-diamide synthase n=1 Tax=Roseibium algae TaxID=3123038 RepID=A0ABU8TQ32_9HYPH